MSLPEIRKYYGVNVKRGQKVKTYEGKIGKVLSAKGLRLRILVDGVRELHHPTWQITYI